MAKGQVKGNREAKKPKVATDRRVFISTRASASERDRHGPALDSEVLVQVALSKPWYETPQWAWP